MALAFALPLVSRIVAGAIGLPLAPLNIGALLTLILRRALTTGAESVERAVVDVGLHACLSPRSNGDRDALSSGPRVDGKIRRRAHGNHARQVRTLFAPWLWPRQAATHRLRRAHPYTLRLGFVGFCSFPAYEVEFPCGLKFYIALRPVASMTAICASGTPVSVRNRRIPDIAGRVCSKDGFLGALRSTRLAPKSPAQIG